MNKIKIGKIINTHALKGELKIALYTDFPFERFKQGNQLFVFMDNEYLKVKVKSFRINKQFGYVFFDEYDDINKVLKFKNKYLFIDKEYVHKLTDGYYFYELVGFKVYDQNNDYLGDVIEVMEGTTHNNLRVKKIGNNRDFLVPMIEQFVLNIDEQENKIMIKVIEGLL